MVSLRSVFLNNKIFIPSAQWRLFFRLFYRGKIRQSISLDFTSTLIIQSSIENIQLYEPT